MQSGSFLLLMPSRRRCNGWWRAPSSRSSCCSARRSGRSWRADDIVTPASFTHRAHLPDFLDRTTEPGANFDCVDRRTAGLAPVGRQRLRRDHPRKHWRAWSNYSARTKRFAPSWWPPTLHDWQGDRFARGAYSYVAVGGGTARQWLASPLEDTLFFAGEATHQDEAATVSGALQSGERAADEIIDAA